MAESTDPKDYWAKTKGRMLRDEGAAQSLTNCQQLKLPAADGKSYKTDCATLETMLRIIQSVPSKRAEPIKRFLAEVGAQHIEELDEPSAAVGRAIKAYRERGRPDEWIDDRLQNISSRNELTDEWKDRGIDTSGKIAGVTRAMTEKMLGVAPKDHKVMKGLSKKDDLRDHYNGLELTIATLGEKTAKALIVKRDTQGYQPTREASMDGAQVAEDARRNIEVKLGEPVANSSNFLTVEVERKRKAVGGPSTPD